jgi:hypothetical protein
MNLYFCYCRNDKASVFEGTVTKLVYETSGGSLILCYEFLDGCDNMLDIVPTEDMSEALWQEVTKLNKGMLLLCKIIY